MAAIIHKVVSALCPIISLQTIEQLETTTPDTQRIYFVRHGESILNIPDANGDMRTSGVSLPIALTKNGESQARELALALCERVRKGEEIVICSSTAVRAQQTATILFEELAKKFKCQMGDQYPGICELSQGEWEGKLKKGPYDDNMKRWKDLSAAERFITPKAYTGESFADVVKRGIPSLQKMIDDNPGKTIFVVSHHATIQAISIKLGYPIEELSKEPGSEMPNVSLDNCEMLQIDVAGKMEAARLIRHIKA